MCFTVEEGNEVLDTINSGKYFQRITILQRIQINEKDKIIENQDIQITVLKGENSDYKNEVSYLRDQIKILGKEKRKKAVRNTFRDIGRYSLIVIGSIGIGILIAQ